VDLDANMVQVLEIPDVERNGRVFSDGVGTISPDAADAVDKAIPASKGFPTAFQIRWAGAKGMLAVDPRLEGSKQQVPLASTKASQLSNPCQEVNPKAPCD
jgi:hypothetical protein